VTLAAPTPEEVDQARRRVEPFVWRTPLLPLAGASGSLFVKLENLQPTGSFKVRGAANALVRDGEHGVNGPIVTASAGNMAQAVGHVARHFGRPFRAVVPDHAPATKLDGVRRAGGEVEKVPFERWWKFLTGEERPGGGRFLHPVCDADVLAGNATLGREVLEELPTLARVIVPFGGGGLSCGIAAAVKAARPDVKVFAAEVETASPLRVSLREGRPCEVEHRASFVDGIGGRSILPAMWTLVSTLLDGSLVVSLAQVAGAVRRLALRHHVVAEGAGAAALAAGLAAGEGDGPTVCIVSGGNLDATPLAAILRGQTPG